MVVFRHLTQGFVSPGSRVDLFLAPAHSFAVVGLLVTTRASVQITRQNLQGKELRRPWLLPVVSVIRRLSRDVWPSLPGEIRL